MKINNVEMPDIDIFDVEVAENYERVIDLIQEMESNVKDMGMTEGIKYECNVIFDIFNIMFGTGADKKIFGNKTNLLICARALDEFMMQINKQYKEMEKLTSKYSPDRIKR